MMQQKDKNAGLTLVVSGMAPVTTLTTLESRYWGTSSAMSAVVATFNSDGLMTTALPAAIAPSWEQSKG